MTMTYSAMRDAECRRLAQTNPGTSLPDRMREAERVLASRGIQRPAAPSAVTGGSGDPVLTALLSAGTIRTHSHADSFLAKHLPGYDAMDSNAKHAARKRVIAATRSPQFKAELSKARGQSVSLLSLYPGRNRHEQAIACLRATESGFAKLAWPEQVARASIWLSKHNTL